MERDLVSMGFALDRVREAVRERGQDLEAALQWLVDHPPPEEAPANASAVETELCAMGFERDRVKRAVRARGNEVHCYFASNSFAMCLVNTDHSPCTRLFVAAGACTAVAHRGWGRTGRASSAGQGAKEE